MSQEVPLEVHPWEPFIPADARLLFAGTFPPPKSRWSMDFYYPNRTNDFWPMMGLIFFGDRRALLSPDGFDLPAIRRLLTEKGIAMTDAARTVRRLKGNASDKFLEIVEPLPLAHLLKRMPALRAVATTGEKAAGVMARLTDTEVPRIGEYVIAPAGFEVWRMPSTSRAYPLPLDRKAAPYAALFRHLGLL